MENKIMPVEEEPGEGLESKNSRFKELLEFIEDFLQSEEYADIMERKRNCLETGVQCDGVFEENVIEREPNVIEPECQKEISFKKLLRKKQKLTIEKIRSIIHEANVKYQCEKDRRERKRLQERQEVLRILKTEYGFLFAGLTIKSKAIDKVIKFRRKRVIEVNMSKKRRCEIISKILREMKRQVQIDREKNKTYDYKVTKRRQLEVTKVEEYVSEIEIPKVDDIVEEMITEKLIEPDPEEKPIEVIQQNRKGSKKNKGSNKKSSKSIKISKPSKKSKKKNGKSKQVKDKKIELEDLILPVIPITNPHEKLTAEQIVSMNLISSIQYVKSLEQLRENFDKERDVVEGNYYPTDYTIFCKPKELIFKNYENEHVYAKQLIIGNGDSLTKKIRHFKTFYVTEEDTNIMKVERTMSIQKLPPGMTYRIPISFEPLNSTKVIRGKCIFITFEPHTGRFRQVIVHFVCSPIVTAIKISPQLIQFSPLPFWEPKHQRVKKSLRIKNTGTNSIRVCICKVDDTANWEEAQSNPPSGNQSCKELRGPTTTPASGLACRGKCRTDCEMKGGTFRFEQYCLTLQPRGESLLNVYLEQMDHVGFFYDRYEVVFYSLEDEFDKIGELFGIQDIHLSAEATGFLIEVMPPILDYGVCVTDAIYQLRFKLCNSTKGTHRARLKMMSCLRDYFVYTKSDIILQPYQTVNINVKFAPKASIYTDIYPYYDKETGIIECPLKVVLVDCPNQPALIVQIYAIMTDSQLFLRPQRQAPYQIQLVDKMFEYLLNLSNCSTNESVYTDIEVHNNCNTDHHFGFLNLPEYIILSPNYGFGSIGPYETRQIQVYFVPQRKDKLTLKTKTIPPLVVTTIKEQGSLKSMIDFGRINRCLKKLETTISKSVFKDSLYASMMTLVEVIHASGDFVFGASTKASLTKSDSRTTIDRDVDEMEVLLEVTGYGSSDSSNTAIGGQRADVLNDEFLDIEYVESKKLKMYGVIADVFVDLSHQFVRFRDTPCGSFSSASITISAHNRYSLPGACAYGDVFDNYTACFEFVGDNSQILIEPTCGVLAPGETVKIHILAKPELEEIDIIRQARNTKIVELKAQKSAELLAEMERQSSKKGAKSKKKVKDSKQKSDKKLKSRKVKAGDKIIEEIVELKDADIVIPEEEIRLTYLDYYPAEMCLWRSIEPYVIESNIACSIIYMNNAQLEGKTQVLYLQTICKVIRPDVFHDQKSQRIDFGVVAIGDRVTRTIKLQNITYENVSPIIFRTNPVGAFSVLDFLPAKLHPEFLLNTQVHFAPTKAEKFVEYFEIRTERTALPFVLQGEAVEIDLHFNPSFMVIRLEAKTNYFTEVSFEIQNKTRATVKLRFESICQLSGLIQSKPVPTSKPAKSSDNRRKAKKSKGSSGKSISSDKSKLKKNKSRRGSVSKNFGDALTEDELHSLENVFEKIEPTEYFVVTSSTSNEKSKAYLQPNSTSTVKVYFGIVPPSKLKSASTTQIHQKKREKSSSKSIKSISRASKLVPKTGKKKSSSSKASRKRGRKSDKGSKKEGDTTYYMCKFNILVGNCTFYKDFIVIGSFV